MVLTDITGGLDLNGNELSFMAAVVIMILFYLQYRKYESEIEREEMIDQFLNIP